jgi:hypothetical protein
MVSSCLFVNPPDANHFSGLLAQTSDNVSAILQVQLDSSTKLHHLMKDMSALSIASQTHLKASTNASKMLECVSWLYNSSQHLENISAGLNQLNQHVQGKLLHLFGLLSFHISSLPDIPLNFLM